MHSAWAWKLLGASFEALTAGLDLMFFPVTRVPLIKTTHTAVFVHDLGFLSHPEYLQEGTEWKTRLAHQMTAWNGDILFTNSFFTGQQFAEHYHVPTDRIYPTGLGFDAAIYHSVKPTPSESKEVLSKYGMRRPYVLYLGVIQGRKNLLRLVQASTLWREQRPDLQLVLAGKRGWKCDDVYRAADRHRGYIKMTGAVDAEHIRVIYQSAECLVIPSLYEGFGVPVIEAMACGTPVVASNTSALREIAGEAGLFFDPLNPGEICSRVLEALEPITRARMVNMGLQRCKLYTWAECAERTAVVMRKYLNLENKTKEEFNACNWNHCG
jgi:glycosyltransferase involved in cell wall biosynthesis